MIRSNRVLLMAGLFLATAVTAQAQWSIAFQDQSKRDLNVVFFLDAPRLAVCFPLDVAESGGPAAAGATRVESLLGDTPVSAGRPVDLRVRLTSADTRSPRDGLADEGLGDGVERAHLGHERTARLLGRLASGRAPLLHAALGLLALPHLSSWKCQRQSLGRCDRVAQNQRPQPLFFQFPQWRSWSYPDHRPLGRRQDRALELPDGADRKDRCPADIHRQGSRCANLCPGKRWHLPRAA